MKAIVLSILLISVVSVGAQNLEDGWKGILPLKATKADVEKAYGPPTDIDDNLYYMYIGEGYNVQINYSTEPCKANRYSRGKYNIPKDTVLDMWVSLKGNVLLSSVKFDRSKFTRRPDEELTNLVHYYRGDIGMTITSEMRDKEGNEYLGRVIYRPPSTPDPNVICPK